MESKNKFWIFGELSYALAFFVGGFSLLNILGEIRFDGFDANYWWIDFCRLSPYISKPVLLITSVLLVILAFRRKLPSIPLKLLRLLLCFLLIVCIFNSITFFSLISKNVITSQFPIPFSLIIAAALVAILIATFKKFPGNRSPRDWFVFLCWTFLLLIIFPLCQIFCFGKTDYRREADAVVVFGARVYADGTMSTALLDRTVTGCNLVLKEYADLIIFSGGPGDGDIHETEAMKAKAIRKGIPKEAIILDKNGLNTQHTVDNTTKIFAQKGINRILVVSHFYHLPRIKMTYRRDGYDVYTVPAKESYTLTAMPKYILREIAALWKYYLTPLAITPPQQKSATK